LRRGQLTVSRGVAIAGNAATRECDISFQQGSDKGGYDKASPRQEGSRQTSNRGGVIIVLEPVCRREVGVCSGGADNTKEAKNI